MPNLVIKRSDVGQEPVNSSSLSQQQYLDSMRIGARFDTTETETEIIFHPKDDSESKMIRIFFDYYNLKFKEIKTRTETKELPDSLSFLSYSEDQEISELVALQTKAEEAEEEYQAQRKTVQLIFNKAKKDGHIDKTAVHRGIEITLNTRKNYVFGASVQALEEAAKSLSDAISRRKAAEIENGAATKTPDTVYISINKKASLEYDKEKEVWISTYKTKC